MASNGAPSSGKTELEIDKLFRATVKLGGSDLHLKVGAPPHARVSGDLRPFNRGPIDDDEMNRMIYGMIDADTRLKERRRKILEDDGGSTSRTPSRSKASGGGSVSTCFSRWATWDWSPGA